MKLVILSVLTTSGLLLGQSPSPAAQATAASLSAVSMPPIIACGGAYNQFAGGNLFCTGILPISTAAALYESTTVDIFPVKATVAGKSGYLFTTSAREGVHRVIHEDDKNMLLFGADAGVVLPTSASGVSVSAAVSLTYVRHITPSWAVMGLGRTLYLPTLGGWNPILEIGIVWKPGAKP